MLRRTRILIASFALLLLIAAPAAAADISHEFTVKSDDLKFTNLIGEITVIEADGNDFEIQIVVRGDDAEDGVLAFESSDDGEDVFAIRYPLDKHEIGRAHV